MKAGEVPGHKQIKDVFADDIHLNNVGSYVGRLHVLRHAVSARPEGTISELYKVTDPKLAEVIQDTVWKVVSKHELAGVSE